jgi:hypothetical protein
MRVKNLGLEGIFQDGSQHFQLVISDRHSMPLYGQSNFTSLLEMFKKLFSSFRTIKQSTQGVAAFPVQNLPA